VYDGELRLRSVEPTSESGRGSFEGEFGEDILLILSGSTCSESDSALLDIIRLIHTDSETIAGAGHTRPRNVD